MTGGGRPSGSKDIRVWRDGKYVTPRSLPTEERFMCYVEKQEDGCWQWIGTRSRTSYGRFTLSGRVLSAHRFSYEHFRAPIPTGLEIDHLCRNRACVNPDHLEPVTHRTNVLRSPENPISIGANRATCPEGHALPDVQGKRRCFTCQPAAKSTTQRLAASYAVEPTGCWRWTGEIVNGYPRFFAEGRRWQAARYIYRLTMGPIQEGASLVNGCDRPCVNPGHQRPVVDRRWRPKVA